MAGEFAARKMRKDRKRFRWRKEKYRMRVLQWRKKKDPLGGAPLATGIVLEKRVVEQKQPSSGLIKCVRVRLIKNGMQVTAFVPKTGAINAIAEHDQVLIGGAGGSQNGPFGSIPGVKFKVLQVNGIDLEQIRRGKKQKPIR